MSALETWYFREEWAWKQGQSRAWTLSREVVLSVFRNFLHIITGFPLPPRRTSQLLSRMGWGFFIFLLIAAYEAVRLDSNSSRS